MALMLRDASQHSGGRSSSRPRARKSGLPDLRLLKRPISGKPEIGCDAPQHEGPCARRILASQAAARARRTNLRLWETIADSVSLFPACSLQGTPQLQRVEPSARGPPISRIQGVALYFSLLFRGAAERRSATSVAG